MGTGGQSGESQKSGTYNHMILLPNNSLRKKYDDRLKKGLAGLGT